MAKKKKTREQKILADNRHFHYHLEIPTKKINSIPSPVTKPAATALVNYNFVLSDIKKTASVTALILVSQVVLFFLLQRI
jgi:hypothetical protein